MFQNVYRFLFFANLDRSATLLVLVLFIYVLYVNVFVLLFFNYANCPRYSIKYCSHQITVLVRS